MGFLACGLPSLRKISLISSRKRDEKKTTDAGLPQTDRTRVLARDQLRPDLIRLCRPGPESINRKLREALG